MGAPVPTPRQLPKAQPSQPPWLGFFLSARHFPLPWSGDNPESKLDRQCFIVRDGNGEALAYVYFEEEPGGDLDPLGGSTVDRAVTEVEDAQRGRAQTAKM